MKNFGLLILGIIVGVAAMYFYSKSDQMEMKADDIEMKIPGLITPEEATALDQAFNLKHRIISDSLFKGSKTGDNRSSYWAIEDIQNYIKHAENQAGELGYIMDGLRIYLGSYPGKDGENGLTTMFFVPTGTVNTSQGSMLSLPQGDSNDIKGADGLNFGQNGYPPNANYPQ
jgi:hypothetical protein